MATPDELRRWTKEVIYAQIEQSLPEGWTFDLAASEHCFRARVKDSQGLVIWENTSFDIRLLLLDTYGWLWLRDKKPSSEVWTRRREVRPAEIPVGPVTLSGITLPDPEDLDPKEIAAVYKPYQRS